MISEGDLVLYLPPAHPAQTELPRLGRVMVISGASALVRYDDDPWPIWAPLCRLQTVTLADSGWLQCRLF